MLFYPFATEGITNIFETFGYLLDPGAIRRNIDCYLRRTSYDSALSIIILAAVLACYDGRNLGGCSKTRSRARCATSRAEPLQKASILG